MIKTNNYQKYEIIKTNKYFVDVFIMHIDKTNVIDIHSLQHKKAYEMLKEILENNFGYSNVIIKKDSNGKPYLVNIDEICFSISHKDYYIIIAISNLKIGIDIETYHNNNDNIQSKFFSYNEQIYINDEKNNQERFYEVWTKKEAFIKARNEHSIFTMNQFDVFNKEIKNNFYTVKTTEYIYSLYIDKYSNSKIK